MRGITRRHLVRILLVAVALVVDACGGESPEVGDGGTDSPTCEVIPDEEYALCDPLEPIDKPIVLGDVIAIGQDAEGVIYLADEWDGQSRVFVSEGDVLVRKFVAGSGEGSSGGDYHYMFIVQEGEDLFTLAIEIPEGGETKMAVGQGDHELSIEELAALGEWLTVLDEDAISGMDLQNLPGIVSVEYLAEVEDGRWVVVVRPEYDWSYEDFVLFLGPGSDLAQRMILEVLRYSDGGTTVLGFCLDDAEATLHFPIEFSDSGEFEWGDAYLETEDDTLSLSWLETDSHDLGEFSFYCSESI
jgi:hypothetical protein